MPFSERYRKSAVAGLMMGLLEVGCGENHRGLYPCKQEKFGSNKEPFG